MKSGAEESQAQWLSPCSTQRPRPGGTRVPCLLDRSAGSKTDPIEMTVIDRAPAVRCALCGRSGTVGSTNETNELRSTVSSGSATVTGAGALAVTHAQGPPAPAGHAPAAVACILAFAGRRGLLVPGPRGPRRIAQATIWSCERPLPHRTASTPGRVVARRVAAYIVAALSLQCCDSSSAPCCRPVASRVNIMP
jgi:hypothetical protein